MNIFTITIILFSLGSLFFSFYTFKEYFMYSKEVMGTFIEEETVEETTIKDHKSHTEEKTYGLFSYEVDGTYYEERSQDELTQEMKMYLRPSSPLPLYVHTKNPKLFKLDLSRMELVKGGLWLLLAIILFLLAL